MDYQNPEDRQSIEQAVIGQDYQAAREQLLDLNIWLADSRTYMTAQFTPHRLCVTVDDSSIITGTQGWG